jgi:hypothetical protein
MHAARAMGGPGGLACVPRALTRPGAGDCLKFVGAVLRMGSVPTNISRLILVFGLSGWALMLSLVAAALLFLKVIDWPSVGWFVDAAGNFAGFGFIRAGDGWREVLGSWSLPMFASTAAALAWIGALGTRSGIRTLRTLLGV